MRKKNTGLVFVVLGAVLMLSALLLVIHNTIESQNAGNASQEALAVVHQAINNPEANTEIAEEITVDVDETSEILFEPEQLDVIDIDGYQYIGFLSIPAFELELPVQSEATEEGLFKSPCLQYGAPMMDDAVIAAHNYKYHFLPLHDIEIGENVFFTYINGFTVDYEVKDWKIIAQTDISAVQESEHDLVLYTCTSSGTSRVAVFCDRIENTKKPR